MEFALLFTDHNFIHLFPHSRLNKPFLWQTGRTRPTQTRAADRLVSKTTLAACKQGISIDIYKIGKISHVKLKAKLGVWVKNALRL